MGASLALAHFGAARPCAGQPSQVLLPLTLSFLQKLLLLGHHHGLCQTTLIEGQIHQLPHHLAVVHPTSALNIHQASGLAIQFLLAHNVRFFCGHCGFHKAKRRALLSSNGCLPNGLFQATSTGRCRPFEAIGCRFLFHRRAAGSRPFQAPLTCKACYLGGLATWCSAAHTLMQSKDCASSCASESSSVPLSPTAVAMLTAIAAFDFSVAGGSTLCR